MATVAEIRDRAANDLGILRLGQSLQSQDSTRITSGYNEVYQQLKVDGLATWTSSGDVPTELVPHVVVLVAHNCLNAYGVAPERYQRIINASGVDGEKAKKEIKKLVTSYQPSQDNATDY